MGKKEAKGTGLTDKQRAFALEYLKDRNAKQAAIRAGYSAHTAEQQGSRLLRNAQVKAFLEQRTNKIEQRLELSAERILQELARVALADVGQAYTEDGQLKPLHEMPEDIRRAISGLEVEELFDGVGEERHQIGLLKKVKFWNKVDGLDKLARHFGLLKERVEVTGKDGGPVQVADARTMLAAEIEKIAQRNKGSGGN